MNPSSSAKPDLDQTINTNHPHMSHHQSITQINSSPSKNRPTATTTTSTTSLPSPNNSELLREDVLLSIKSYPPITNHSKRLIPPPLDLSRSTPASSSSSSLSPSTNMPTGSKRPETPLSNTFSSHPPSAHLVPLTSSDPSPISSSSYSPTLTTQPSKTIAGTHLYKPLEEDLAIEDEERQAAEWMGSCSHNANTQSLDHSFNQDLAHRILNPIPLLPNSHQSQDEDGGLTTMEKIFLFAKSENAHHRVIVSQRLPELLEEVDITEAVEYVLPLLSGLTQDDEMIREALAPTFCNVMWYYFSRCPLTDTQDSINDFQPPPDSSNSCKSSVDGCTTPNSLDWLPDGPRRRPQISINSFTASLITLLTDTDRSVGLLTRYGFVVFLCRLVKCPLPDWSEDLKLLSGEPFSPVDYPGMNCRDQYEEYTFADAIRNKIASELVDLVIDDLCGSQQHVSSSSRTKLDHVDSNESDEWDTVPLNGDESEHPQTAYLTRALNPPSNLHTTSFLFDPSLSQYSADNFKPTDSLDHLHRQQIGLILVESIAQARCLDSSFMYHKLLPQLIQGNLFDQNCRAVRQQAASTLTALMISLSSPPLVTLLCTPIETSEESENLLIDSYRSFASDMDPEVRKQIVLGLPALLKLVHRRSKTELSLDFMEQFSRDKNREVRIVGCQILGELIHVFHLGNSDVPNQLVDCFLSGFENNQQRPIHEELEGERMTNRSNFFSGRSMYFDEITSSPGPLDQFADLTQDLQLAPQTSSFFGTSGLSAEQMERAMCCSYNFPAVLLTLGVERWEDLKNVFLKLATDITYPPKIRRSLARSMHELIKIIRAPIKQSTAPRSRSLATEDWIKVLNFFLFEDQELTNTESVLETLDISLGHVNVAVPLSSSQDSQQVVIIIIDIIDKLSELFTPSNNDEALLVNRRKISWTIREKLALLLPKLFTKLKEQLQQACFQNNKNHLVGLDIEKELEKCFETLLFLGLHDPAAAVREASLEFVPIFFSNLDSNSNEGENDESSSKKQKRIGREELQKKLIEKLKLLSLNSNYRVRMIYPKAISILVLNNAISIDFFENEILTNGQLIEISRDKVSGVRISLGRLIYQLCHSQQFYSYYFFNNSHHSDLRQIRPSLPQALQRLIIVLSNDPESIVCSFVENFIGKISQHDTALEANEQEEMVERSGIQEAKRRRSGHLGEGNSQTGLITNNQQSQTPQTTHDEKKLIFNNHNSHNDVRFTESLDDDDSDDLSGSGIKVEDETRLSEDEGVQISLGGEEVDFFNPSSPSLSEEDYENSDKISSTPRRHDLNHKGGKSDLVSGETSITDRRIDSRYYNHHQDNNYLFQYSSSSAPFVKLNSPVGSNSSSGSGEELDDDDDDDDDQLLVSNSSGLDPGRNHRAVNVPIPGSSSNCNSANIPNFNFSHSSEMPRNSNLDSDRSPDFPRLDSNLGRVDFLETTSIGADPTSLPVSDNNNIRIDVIRRSVSEPVSCNTTPTKIRLPSSSSSPSRNHYSTAGSWGSSTDSNSFASSSSCSSRDQNEGLVMIHSSESLSKPQLSNTRIRTRTENKNENPNYRHDDHEDPESTATSRRRRRNSTGDNSNHGHNDQMNARNEQDCLCINQTIPFPHSTTTTPTAAATTRASNQHFTVHSRPSSVTTTSSHPLVARLIKPSLPPSNSSNSNPHTKNVYPSGEQIWMRETDGGFVEVGEY